MCSVLVNKLSPSQSVAQALPNAAANERVDDLVATRHAVATRAGRTYDTIYFTSPSIPGDEISAAKKIVVTAQGHADLVWEHFGAAVPAFIPPNLPPIFTETEAIGDLIFLTKDLRSMTTMTQLPKMSRGQMRRHKLTAGYMQANHGKGWD